MQYVTKNQFRTETKEERERNTARHAEEIIKEHFRKEKESGTGRAVLSSVGRGQK